MKVIRRTIPNDMLSAEQKGKTLSVSTHRRVIHVNIWKGSELVIYQEFTFDQFCEVFEQRQETKP